MIAFNTDTSATSVDTYLMSTSGCHCTWTVCQCPRNTEVVRIPAAIYGYPASNRSNKWFDDAIKQLRLQPNGVLAFLASILAPLEPPVPVPVLASRVLTKQNRWFALKRRAR